MIPCNLLSSSISTPQTIPILNPNASPSSPPLPPRSRRRFRCRCRRSGGSRWDSNAESFRFRFQDEGGESGKSSDGARRWWSDEAEDEFDDEFDPFDEDTEDFWDKIWIFKVFKAYGYLLPAIIASFLLTTGPKAFLMALALPLGQSAISLAVEKLWGRACEGRRYKPEAKRKPFTGPSSKFRKRDKEERSGGGGRNGYQSWVSADSGVADRVSDSRRSGFGGWDELDDQMGPMRRRSPMAGGSSPAEGMKQGKLSKRGRYSRDAPLFLRLLIAVFPFLGSWTRIL